MTIAAITLILLLPLLTIWRDSGKLTPIVLTTVSLSPILLGYVQFDVLRETHVAMLYCAGLGCFLAGYFTYGGLRSRRRMAGVNAPGLPTFANHSEPAILAFVGIVLAATLYHQVAVGIPLLSDDPETVRFDFTSSGLFGLPGRMFLFGLPFTVLLVSLAHGRGLLPVSQLLLRTVWGAYITASLLGGFKGGLLNVVTMMLLVRGLIGRPLPVRSLVAGWRSVLIIGAVLYVGLVAFTYKSIRMVNFKGFAPYLAARATVIPAAPGYFALSRFGTRGSGGAQYAQDARYFLNKYLGISGSESSTLLPLDKTVSAALYNTPISATSFIVPVTIGAFPEMIVNLGSLAAVLVCLSLGWLFAHMVACAQASLSLLRSGIYAFAVHLLHVYMLNGNLVYSLFNFVAMSTILFLLYRLSELCFPSLRVQAPDRKGDSVGDLTDEQLWRAEG